MLARARQAYSVADHRVKELAYVLKRWAKRRWVNNASEGTLSSYGYLLCLLHFLQTRSPPVVPNLQVRRFLCLRTFFKRVCSVCRRCGWEG